MKTDELMIATDAAVLAFFVPGVFLSAGAVLAGASWHLFSFAVCLLVTCVYARDMARCIKRILKGGKHESR
jgi:hypothetical protein